MCRGFEPNEKELLKIRAFYAELPPPRSINCRKSNLPDYLTLHYLPRINEGLLEIDGSRIRPDSSGFMTLHRVVSGSDGSTKYGSRERVVACEGARFEIYAGEVRVLNGIFRRDERLWKVECECTTSDLAEMLMVEVEEEGRPVKVEIVRKQRRRVAGGELEEIPEVGEGDYKCWCSECGGGVEEVEEEEEEMEEGVRWAVEVGIWAVCFGVGYLISVSTSKRLNLRRNKL
ncbi:Unknown protein [Striga hermonthica]|uniref:Uncharacterized protein n=1 Tax=Striga hermonthica TaxID=68872 RepID=A0A9N7NDE0_STRHE|nr:Unknown protein [Striga hermonthica]